MVGFSFRRCECRGGRRARIALLLAPGTVLILLLGGGAVVSRGDEAARGSGADYVREIKPLLRQRCYACHGGLKQKAGLRLDTGASIRRGGDSGPAVEPGRSDESLLIDRVAEQDPKLRMPPEGAPLSAEQVSLLRGWIDQGTNSPRDEQPEENPRRHWSFVRPVRPVVPTISTDQEIRNPIDVFLQIERDRRGLKPLPRAEPSVLLRRLYIDLIGLPPTRSQLHEFLRDPSDTAYERIVERLLASPRHGERWARHWMDVWRYSDWYGRRAVPDVLNSYAMIYRWRDWIVGSLNQDRGYDWMVRQMLAADELNPAEDSNVVATGFVVRNFYRWNYNLWLKDTVEHTAKAFLGLTVQCAHCHDHKYDPVTQEDYFALRACFEPIEIRHDRVPGEADPGPFPKYEYGKAYAPISSGIVRVFDANLDAKTFLYTRGESRNVVAGRPPVAPGVPAFLSNDSFHLDMVSLPSEVQYPGLKEFVRREETEKRSGEVARRSQTLARTRAELIEAEKGLSRAESVVTGGHVLLSSTIPDGKATATARARLEAARRKLSIDELDLAAAQAELASIHARINADLIRFGKQPGDVKAARLAAVKAEQDASVATALAAMARTEQDLATLKEKSSREPKARAGLGTAESRLLEARKAVEAARKLATQVSSDYTPLSPSYPPRSTGRRSALARWITDSRNPLTARVAVNHIWRWHFNRPLVASTYDFGRNGKRPTHQALLDWLATEFVHTGWSMKAMHRLIVTSAAYRMDSHPVATGQPGLSGDPENFWYWRFNPARMESEVLRDSLLSVSGSLDPLMGGPDIDFNQGFTTHRRSLYLSHHGEGRMQFLELFDAPDACEAYTRTVSVVPQQALSLTNNAAAQCFGQNLASALWTSTDHEDEADSDRVGRFILAAFEAVLCRGPSKAEREVSQDFLARQEQLFDTSRHPATAGGGQVVDSAARARANLVQALFNHNDFLTIH